MRPLFVRVLLVLLGSFLVVALVSTLLSRWINSELDPREDRLMDLAAEVAREVVDKYEAGEFREFRRHLGREFNTRIWLAETSTGEWHPRPPPREILDQVTTAPQVIMPYQNTSGRFFIFSKDIPGTRSAHRVVMTSKRPVFPHYRKPGKTLFPLAILLVGLCVASALLSYWVLRPIREIRRTSSAISGDNLNARVPRQITRRKDAFGELGREINHMTERVQETIENQNRLLRDVSHDLRSPLARIQVANSLLEQKHGQGEEIDRISSEITRLDNMIGDLVSLSRMQNMKTLPKQKIDLTALLERVIENVNFEFQAVGTRAELSEKMELEILGDPELLTRLFENVLRNALRFSPDKERVEVVSSRNQSMSTISILDKGPGVPAPDLDKIFDPFFQTDDSRKVGTDNHGIGLALVRTISRLHGGRVTAYNRPEGGLEIRIQIPLA